MNDFPHSLSAGDTGMERTMLYLSNPAESHQVALFIEQRIAGVFVIALG